MYHWTHIELARHQSNGNGPKTDYDERVANQKQSDNEQCLNDNSSRTVIVRSEERGESFATMKNKLLLCETKISTTETAVENEDQVESNSISTLHATENGEVQRGLAEEAQIGSDMLNGYQKIDDNLQQNCDMVDKAFVETSTQTDDDAMEKIFKLQKSEDLKASLAPPPPPPPPPPSPIPSTLVAAESDESNNPTNDKPTVVTEQPPVTPQQNNSPNINISSTKLSSASSFCPPPPPPMNGVPGPPPLPLPTGNIWFQSDSKFNSEFNLFRFSFV